MIPGAILLAGVLIGGAVVFSQGGSPGTASPTEAVQPPTAAEEVTGDINIEFAGFPSIGDPDAPVTIVEYSDYACPFCQRFWSDTLPLIKENYVDTGQVRFVYKDFTVVGGDRIAEAAHCAGEQDAYWEFHDLAFERHSQDRGQWGNSDVHRGYAQELGLDANALVECFEERRYQQRVAESTREAAANGGRGTPYFLVNDQSISGAQPFQAFQAAIDAQL